MERSEYLTALRQYISERGMRPEDVDEAMGFYGDIIMEGSQEEFERLGTVEKLGNGILAEYNIFTGGQGGFPMQSAFMPGTEQQQAPRPQNGLDDQKKKTLLIILLIAAVTFPLWTGILGGSFGVIIGVGAALIAIIIAFIAAGAVLTFEGVLMMFEALPVGFVLCGAGLVLLGLCGAAFIPLFKAFVRFVVWLFKTLFNWAKNTVLGVSA